MCNMTMMQYKLHGVMTKRWERMIAVGGDEISRLRSSDRV
jgi:hypothetical protein